MSLKAPNSSHSKRKLKSERGAALVTSVLILGMLSAIAITVLTVVQKESQIAGSDLKRTQTFYAAAAGIEKMTSDFNALFNSTSRPTPAQLLRIRDSPPQELTDEGYQMSQLIGLDGTALTAMRQTQGIGPDAYPRVTVPGGPFNGLSASVAPYVLSSMATSTVDGTEVALTRTMNNYLIPIFQFGMFSNRDIELHPGPAFSFNGRVHANGNVYVTGNVTFLAKVTSANELIYDVVRNGTTRTGNVSMKVGAVTVPLTMGSMFGGPNIVGANPGERGYFPNSADGTINGAWDTTSVGPATAGVPNQFGGQLQTRSTGAGQLLLPLQLRGAATWEIIKRRMPGDGQEVSDSRYHSKAQIRILLDDETPSTTDASGIPAGQGVFLSAFDPIPLPNIAAPSGGRALWRINDNGSYRDSAANCVLQEQGGTPGQAITVRGVKSATQAVTLNGTATNIPAGAGLSGRILIQIVDDSGNIFDVTREVLSMGMTYGEPNAIVTLQRPLWAAFVQGSRDSTGGANVAPDGTAYSNSLTDILNRTYIAADGEINTSPGPAQDGTYGYLTAVVDDDAGQPQRADSTPYPVISDWGTATWTDNKNWNAIVPINVYNVREGCITGTGCGDVYERGITNVIELNMKNLARWVSGVYDSNLLAGSSAVSTNIGSPGGYTVYVSDRRGDRVNSVVHGGVTIDSSNGMVDNEDIYGPNNTLDFGEDVQETGVLVKDTAELPDPAILAGVYGTDLTMRALTVSAWSNPANYFRRSVRLFDGEDLVIPGGALSTSNGISVATENMLYTWGNYNSTGINLAPPNGTASLNDPAQPFNYLGNQVPASIVSDAFFPLSKTWSDGAIAMYPDVLGRRQADRNRGSDTDETAVRVGIIAGNNMGALAGSPDAGNTASGESRLNGGMHNFPRFLERWSYRWNFVGSLIPLYHSTQALGPYNSDSTIYGAPIRNWAFDSSFLDPNRLPPSTPQFQYIQPTAFRQIL